MDYWQYALDTAVRVHNRVTVVAEHGRTQHELFTGERPDVSHFHVFGCDAFVLLPPNKKGSKLDEKSAKGIFVGYDETRGCYKVLLENAKPGDKPISSRDVKFMEDKFTVNREKMSKSKEKEEVELNSSKTEVMSDDELDELEEENEEEEEDDELEEEEEKEEAEEIEPAEQIDIRTQRRIEASEQRRDEVAAAHKKAARRSTRKRKSAKRDGLNLDDFGAVGLQASAEPVIHARDVKVPQSRREAMSGPWAGKWKAAEESEMASIRAANTYRVVKNPGSVNIVKCKWVYAVKTEGDVVTRFKARLVACGYSQKEGVDFNFDGTFAPVLRQKTLRVVMAIAAAKRYTLEVMDVGNAYLNAELKETIYMAQPQGYETGDDGSVCLLDKSLYGLRQSGRGWNEHLNAFLLELGFTRCVSDTCVYVKQSRKGNLMLLSTYVDDIPSAHSPADDVEWAEIKKRFDNKYKIKFLGESEWLLNMRITRDKETGRILLDQQSYVQEILEEMRMENCTPEASPAAATALSQADGPTSDQEKERMKTVPYRRVVGLLMYLANSTRPDITHAVRTVAQFAQNPGENHWRAVKRILRYLRGTSHYGLAFGGSSGNSKSMFAITSFADADWAGCKESRRSTTGSVIQIGESIVDWSCKKQKTVALSSCEAEYMASGSALQSMMWVKKMLEELGVRKATGDGRDGGAMALQLKNDNQSAIAICKNDVLHDRVRHIDIRHHFIREQVNNKTVEVKWIPTTEQVADILTKPLRGKVFDKFRDALVQAVHKE